MKKLIFSLAAVLMLAALCVTSVSAAGTGAMALSLGSASAEPGDTVTLTLSVSANPGFCYLKIKFSYDKSALSLTALSNGTVSTDSFTPVLEQAAASWDSEEDARANGTLISATFKVGDGAQGEYPIGISVVGCYNYDENIVTTSVSGGSISVGSGADENGIVISSKTVTLDAGTIEDGMGESKNITLSTVPAKQEIEWSVDDPALVSVGYSCDRNGVWTFSFTPKAAGETTFRASMNYNGSTYTETCRILIEHGGTYTVSYNANGGTGAPANQTKTHGTTLTLSSTKPTKAYTITYNANGGSVSPSSKSVSCTFKNWNTAQGGTGTTYDSGASYTANAAATLYAQWTNPTAGTLPTPTRSNYSFAGWYTASSGGTQVTSSTTITGSQTIYARWTASATYTITYNANGGTGAPANQTKVHGTALTLSSTKPTKAYTITYNANGGSVSPSSKSVSCTFKNWNTAQNGTGTAYDSGASYTANAAATLYAQWTNPTAGTLPTPTRSNYSFAGWHTAASGGTQVTSSTAITGNQTIYARWTADTIPVTGITLDQTSITTRYLYRNTIKLTATVTPDTATDKGVTWKSDNENVATVDADGNIKTTGRGTATIIATTDDGAKTASCTVTVEYRWWQWLIAVLFFWWRRH